MRRDENWLCRIIGHRMTYRATYYCGCYTERCGRKGCKAGNCGLNIMPTFGDNPRPSHEYCPMAP